MSLYNFMSLKNRIYCRGTTSFTQKELYNLTTNVKTYKRETEALRQAKDAFERKHSMLRMRNFVVRWRRSWTVFTSSCKERGM